MAVLGKPCSPEHLHPVSPAPLSFYFITSLVFPLVCHRSHLTDIFFFLKTTYGAIFTCCKIHWELMSPWFSAVGDNWSLYCNHHANPSSPPEETLYPPRASLCPFLWMTLRSPVLDSLAYAWGHIGFCVYPLENTETPCCVSDLQSSSVLTHHPF